MTDQPDPRTAVLSAMAYPPYNETAEARCTPWGEAEQLLNAYRDAVLAERAAVPPAADRTAHDRTVAYRSPGTRALYCVICARQEPGWEPVTAAETAEQAVCDFCGGRVLVVAARSLGEAVARYLPEPADRAADGTALLREAADWYARQGKVVLAASQVAADLRRRADTETTAVSFARMLAGAAVLSGRSDALPFDDEEMPPAERERYLTRARQLLARADETQPLPSSTAPLAAGFPLVKGNCPACRHASLFLGTGGYPTCSNHECPEPDAATTVLEQYANEAHPPSHTWKVESPRRDQWASWGATYDERVWAAASFEDVIEVAPQRPFRLVRATTTYVVEAEHQPEAAAEAQQDGAQP
jgi:hypothetical protein